MIDPDDIMGYDEDGSPFIRCWQCQGTGLYGHDCIYVDCICGNPEDNRTCDICHGEGGYIVKREAEDRP